MESNYSTYSVNHADAWTVANAVLESNYSREQPSAPMLAHCSQCGFGEQLQRRTAVLEEHGTVANAVLESNYSVRVDDPDGGHTVANAVLESNYSLKDEKAQA